MSAMPGPSSVARTTIPCLPLSSTVRVVIDVTALDVLDSFATRTLRGIAYTARLRGAETVIVGIQPDVAFAMVQLGLGLDGVATALDLEDGLAHLDDVAPHGGLRAR